MIPLHDFAVGADHGGAEVVRDQAALGLNGKREEIGDLGQVGWTGSGELPAAEQSGVMGVGDRESVIAQDLGRVVLRVES